MCEKDKETQMIVNIILVGLLIHSPPPHSIHKAILFHSIYTENQLNAYRMKDVLKHKISKHIPRFFLYFYVSCFNAYIGVKVVMTNG